MRVAEGGPTLELATSWAADESAEPGDLPIAASVPPPLATESDLRRAGPSEQSRRPHDEHDDEYREPHGALQRGVDVVAGHRLSQADDQPADIGTPEAPEPAEHDHG